MELSSLSSVSDFLFSSLLPWSLSKSLRQSWQRSQIMWRLRSIKPTREHASLRSLPCWHSHLARVITFLSEFECLICSPAPLLLCSSSALLLFCSSALLLFCSSALLLFCSSAPLFLCLLPLILFLLFSLTSLFLFRYFTSFIPLFTLTVFLVKSEISS